MLWPWLWPFCWSWAVGTPTPANSHSPLLSSEKSRRSSHIHLSHLWQRLMLEVFLNLRKESCVVACGGLVWRCLSDKWSLVHSPDHYRRRCGAGQGDKYCCVVATYLIVIPPGGCCRRPWAVSTQYSSALVWCQGPGLVPPGSCGISSSVVVHVGGTVKGSDKLREICFTGTALW